ncbi:hypothetical protein BP00DRAFT_461103 [Aspergillus indologenus CBS 114.80]|uniref:tRNA(Ile)-lysidine synthetase n=1 Tax=Aspergillus indologenus CBS 114.80 TaxID=1450541 RepID=A0A2V5HXL8_9EURO|nr:hypothetical protein BP00DRAFT_461103 [Aspergillus indologenus CBS 114.80]
MAISELLHQNKPTAITVSQFVNAFQQIWHDSRMRGAQRAQDPRARARARFPSRLGLAISGGADSMALAYLCREWEKSTSTSGANDTSTNHPPAIKVTAFIVDHRARAESAHEAATVAAWLAAMGITTQILPLDWSHLTTSPQTLPAFETHARRLRFQALGRACRAAAIDALLTGHHRDDAVETTLWRLCTGARGPGLAGIPACTGIPECHGVFGVCGSRGVEGLRTSYPRPSPYPYSDHPRVGSGQQAPMATGTLPIIRPLLGFPKSDLLATCAAHGVPFVSDPTNFDPTLTPRNAIRKVLADGTLPRALRGESVVRLMGASQRLIRRAEEDAERVLRRCAVGGFVPETGVVGVRFPAAASSGEGEGGSEGAAAERQVQIQALALRRITELVSPFPKNHFSLRAFEAFVARVFPSAAQQGHEQEQQQEQSFTLGGVLFQPWSVSPKKKGQGEESIFQGPATAHSHGPDTPETDNNSSSPKTWLLARQPYMKNRTPRLDIHLDGTDGSGSTTERKEQNQNQNQNQKQDQDQGQEEWHLWDNRYWFRVGWTGTKQPQPQPPPPSNPNPTTQTQTQPHPQNQEQDQDQDPKPTQTIHLRIRPLQKADLNRLRQSRPNPHKNTRKQPQTNNNPRTETATDLDPESHRDRDPESGHAPTHTTEIPDPDPKALTRLLAQASPGRTRFTVPVLVLVLVRRRQPQPQGRKVERGGIVDVEAEVEAEAATEEEEIPLALPTLDLWLPSRLEQHQEWPDGKGKSLSWEWRYKSVDRRTLRLMGWEE